MSNAIQFLEAMGRDATLSRLSAAGYAATVAALNVDASQQEALLARSETSLNELLGGREKVLFAIMTPIDGDKGAVGCD